MAAVDGKDAIIMGYAARQNPRTLPQAQRRLTAERQLCAVLALFPDRSTFEQWATARQLDDVARAHLESRLPAHLQAQGVA